MKKFFLIYVLFWLYSCSGTDKVNTNTQKTSITNKQNSEKIEKIIYSQTGGEIGVNEYLIINKDSIIYHLSNKADDKIPAIDLSLSNNNKDWKAFIDKIDLEDFEKGKPSEELIMDLPTKKL